MRARRIGKFCKLLWSCLAVLPLTFGMGFHRLHQRNPLNPQPILKGSDAPAEVIQIFQEACRDCHSDNTVWPWYSHIAPLSWMIEGDVEKGRSAMNLSQWAGYSTDQRRAYLHEIVPMIQSGLMPLPKYTFIHRKAQLSRCDIDILSTWASRERHRLRLQQPPSSTGNDNIGDDARSSR